MLRLILPYYEANQPTVVYCAECIYIHLIGFHVRTHQASRLYDSAATAIPYPLKTFTSSCSGFAFIVFGVSVCHCRRQWRRRRRRRRRIHFASILFG